MAAEFKIELFHLFIQRGVSLLKTNGRFGYIVPTTILNNVYAENLRSWLLSHCCIDSISVAKGRVFADADVHTSVIILKAEPDLDKRQQYTILTTSDLSESFVLNPTTFAETRQNRFIGLSGLVWNILLNEDNADLIKRITGDLPSLKSVSSINRGLITGNKKKYFADSKVTGDHVEIIGGKNVCRYYTVSPSEFVLFDRPKTAGGCWDKSVHFAPHKIVVRQIGIKPTASIVMQPIAVTGNIFTVRSESLTEEKYLLGILNSRLVSFYWKIMFTDFKVSFPQVTIFSLSQLPIRPIDFDNPEDVAKHDKMVMLVERMLELNKKKAAEKNPGILQQLETQITATDNQIDQLVYKLYDLTDDEIALVEG